MDPSIVLSKTIKKKNSSDVNLATERRDHEPVLATEANDNMQELEVEENRGMSQSKQTKKSFLFEKAFAF